MVIQPKDVSFLFSLDNFESRMMKISGNDVISAKDFDLPVGWQRSKRDVQIRQILVFAAGLQLKKNANCSILSFFPVRSTEGLMMRSNLKERLIRFMLLPVNLGDVIQRPDVHHGFPDEWILSFRSLKIITNDLILMFAVPKNSWKKLENKTLKKTQES